MTEKERFGIVTDTTSGISPVEGEKRDIAVVPIYLIYGENKFRDFVDITASEVKRRFDETRAIPTTSGVNPFDLLEVYKSQLNGRKQIISIHVGKNFSQVTYNSIKTAVEWLQKELELPEKPVAVIDSGQAGPAVGFLVEVAIDLRNQSVSFQNTVSQVQEKCNRLVTIGTIERLDFLKKTGRIPFSSVVIPILQNAMKRSGRRPIIQFINGEWVHPLESLTPFKLDWRRLPKKEEVVGRMVEIALAGRNINRVEIFHFSAENQAEKTADLIKAKSGNTLTPKISQSPASFTAAGPGFVGISILEK